MLTTAEWSRCRRRTATSRTRRAPDRSALPTCRRSNSRTPTPRRSSGSTLTTRPFSRAASGSPVLQWSQTGTPDGVYLHLHSQKYDYTGCFKGSNPPQLQIPEVEWATAFAQSGGKSDPLSVQLSTITGGTVSGAIQETWTFAKGSLAGVVYYNTYGSKLVPGQMGQNGAVMKIAPGAAQPTAFLYTTGTSVFPFGPCVSCHSLSSNGSMLVAQQHFYPGEKPLNGKGSMSFDLTKTPTPDPTNADGEHAERRLGLLGGLSGRHDPAHERRARRLDDDAALPRASAATTRR